MLSRSFFSRFPIFNQKMCGKPITMLSQFYFSV
jgi:hypothetical protein